MSIRVSLSIGSRAAKARSMSSRAAWSGSSAIGVSSNCSRDSKRSTAEGFERNVVGDAEQPRGDGRLAPKTDERPAGTDEAFLRKLLSIVSVTDDAKEIREHRSLVGTEYILQFHSF